MRTFFLYVCQSVSLNLLIHDIEKKVEVVFAILFTCEMLNWFQAVNQGTLP